jgi:hypothetical protein
MTTSPVQSHKELIELGLVKDEGLYFWKGAFVGATREAAVRTVKQIEETAE